MNPQYNFPPFLIIAKQQMNLNLVCVRLIITACLICLIMPYSNGSHYSTTELYNICSSVLYSCGNIKNLGYPFWGHDRPEICGQKEFSLSCNWSNTSHIVIDSTNPWKVAVTNITPSFHTLLARTRSTCPKTVNNQKLAVTSPFKLSASVGNLSLFSDCSTRVFKYQRCRNISCSTFDPNATHVYSYCNFHKSQAYNTGNLSKSCKARIAVPVMKTALEELNHGNGTLESVFDKGFEVEYSVTNEKECLKCQNKGGTCGSSGTPLWEFICYYSAGNSGKKTWRLIMGLGITGGIITVLLVACCWYRKKLKSHSQSMSISGFPEHMTSNPEEGGIYFHVPLFSYRELEEATSSFHPSKELGSGGFGRVYYGKVRDGREVAVKRLFENSYRRVDQFMNEVKILTSFRHQNLVSLYGCTSPNGRELFLVYEYVPNGTVADHLYGNKSVSCLLPWHIRMKIAIETATALSYLHLSDIIHRDVKTNNILLDSSFGVKVADFGLSRLFPNDVTHVSTAPQGTPGYVDPEYHQCYQLTMKSNVYSFGVVLIELLSSLPAVDTDRQRHEINLSSYAINRIKRCAFDELVDPNLGFERDFKIKRMTTSAAELAFQCLQHNKDFRPTMDEVLEALKGIESADYDTLKTREMEGNEGLIQSSKPSPSPTGDDGARLIDTRQKELRSPHSVMHIWHSASTESSTSKQDVKFLTSYQTVL